MRGIDAFPLSQLKIGRVNVVLISLVIYLVNAPLMLRGVSGVLLIKVEIILLSILFVADVFVGRKENVIEWYLKNSIRGDGYVIVFGMFCVVSLKFVLVGSEADGMMVLGEFKNPVFMFLISPLLAVSLAYPVLIVSTYIRGRMLVNGSASS